MAAAHSSAASGIASQSRRRARGRVAVVDHQDLEAVAVQRHAVERAGGGDPVLAALAVAGVPVAEPSGERGERRRQLGADGRGL